MFGETSYVKVLPRWYSQADCVGMTFGDWCVPSSKDGLRRMRQIGYEHYREALPSQILVK